VRRFIQRARQALLTIIAQRFIATVSGLLNPNVLWTS